MSFDEIIQQTTPIKKSNNTTRENKRQFIEDLEALARKHGLNSIQHILPSADLELITVEYMGGGRKEFYISCNSLEQIIRDLVIKGAL